MTSTFVHVKAYKRPIGSNCMHCGCPATVTADRMRVWYCAEHAEIRGDTHPASDREVTT